MRCCVVGAGAAGIIAAKYLKQSGVQYDVFETMDDIGGTWIYTENDMDKFGTPVHTSMYKNLRTNLPKEIMEFEEFKYNMEPSFITPNEVYQYLKDFVNAFNLMDHIKLGYRVINISALEQKWAVTVQETGSKLVKVDHYDSVIVCNGHYFKPRYPDIDGQDQFQGLQLHTKSYRVPSIFKDKNVLLIGFGPSGQDIADDVSKEALTVFLSHHASNFNAEFFKKNVIPRPDVKRLDSNSVTFVDGSSETIDAILYCTGYYYDFPFLDETCDIAVDDNYVRPLYKQMINIKHPTMAFIGIPFRSFIFPLFEIQVKTFVHLLLGKRKLPDNNKMWEELRTFEEDKESKRIPKRKYHQLENIKEYIEEVRSISNIDDLPQVIYKIYDYNHKKRFDSLIQYRKYLYKIKNENNFTVEFINDNKE